MRIALVSDAHLNGPDDPNQRRFIEFLGQLRADRLCLLGDIFQHWWHFGAEPFPQYAEVIEALRPFPLVFVPGNHDWHAARWMQQELQATVGRHIREDWDGLRVLLAHGDEVDQSLGYRGLSALLHSWPFETLVNQMGPERAWRFLGKIAGKPHAHRQPDPQLLAAQEALAQQYLKNADLVVFGHTHAPGRHRFGAGTYVNLGDQVHHHSWLLVEDGQITFFEKTPTTPVV